MLLFRAKIAIFDDKIAIVSPMNIENFLQQKAAETVAALYGPADPAAIQIQKTRKEFEGDYTLVVFPLLKLSRKKPEDTATEIGEALVKNVPEIKGYNVIKGFLNLSLSNQFWGDRLAEVVAQPTGRTIMVEYSSPNTNKPLHLGHIRNNLLGYSVSQILEAAGNRVIKVNLVNDRGIHICKSMLAWQLFGNGETPASSGIKGDHLVGNYYVAFDKAYKAQIKELEAKGMSEEEAKKEAPIMQQAQAMLRKWEAKDPEVYNLWETMNGWVYEGFDKTYKELGISFDKIYYESQTYLLGKSLVEEGLEKGIFFRKEDNSVWIDLAADGLDQKLLLRGDGTSVYMTQDLGTALTRFKEENLDAMIYVVGNEQNYHFQVLSLLLDRLGFRWGKDLVHFSYGMVELPEGKMKSREGTVVDADDLMAKMVTDAAEVSAEMGKLKDIPEEERAEIARIVGMGALKYFLLKVDPRKNMTFNPRESIDFNGNTGPFIQYTYARIRSLLRKAEAEGIEAVPYAAVETGEKETALIQALAEFPEVVRAAGQTYSPALIANYAYDTVKLYNSFYHDCPVLSEPDAGRRSLRLALSRATADTVRTAMGLLGIEVPERM